MKPRSRRWSALFLVVTWVTYRAGRGTRNHAVFPEVRCVLRGRSRKEQEQRHSETTRELVGVTTEPFPLRGALAERRWWAPRVGGHENAVDPLGGPCSPRQRSGGTETNDAQAEIARAVEGEPRLHRPEVRASPQAAGELLDPEFVGVGQPWRRWDRASMLTDLPSMTPGDSGPAIRVEDMRGTRLAPGLVHLTCAAVVDGHRALRSALWWRDGHGRWRTLHHQGTPCPQTRGSGHQDGGEPFQLGDGGGDRGTFSGSGAGEGEQ